MNVKKFLKLDKEKGFFNELSYKVPDFIKNILNFNNKRLQHNINTIREETLEKLNAVLEGKPTVVQEQTKALFVVWSNKVFDNKEIIEAFKSGREVNENTIDIVSNKMMGEFLEFLGFLESAEKRINMNTSEPINLLKVITSDMDDYIKEQAIYNLINQLEKTKSKTHRNRILHDLETLEIKKSDIEKIKNQKSIHSRPRNLSELRIGEKITFVLSKFNIPNDEKNEIQENLGKYLLKLDDSFKETIKVIVETKKSQLHDMNRVLKYFLLTGKFMSTVALLMVLMKTADVASTVAVDAIDGRPIASTHYILNTMFGPKETLIVNKPLDYFFNYLQKNHTGYYNFIQSMTGLTQEQVNFLFNDSTPFSRATEIQNEFNNASLNIFIENIKSMIKNTDDPDAQKELKNIVALVNGGSYKSRGSFASIHNVAGKIVNFISRVEDVPASTKNFLTNEGLVTFYDTQYHGEQKPTKCMKPENSEIAYSSNMIGDQLEPEPSWECTTRAISRAYNDELNKLFKKVGLWGMLKSIFDDKSFTAGLINNVVLTLAELKSNLGIGQYIDTGTRLNKNITYILFMFLAMYMSSFLRKTNGKVNESNASESVRVGKRWVEISAIIAYISNMFLGSFFPR